MTIADRKWLIEIESWRGWKVSKSFIERLDAQLKSEFEELTGKCFDGRRYHFQIGYENELEYNELVTVPFGKISGTLMFGRSIDISFIWFDLTTKMLYRIEDDISNSNVEFHWIDLLVRDPSIMSIKLNSLIDIRTSHNIDCNFPVMVYAGEIGTDVSFNFKLPNSSVIHELLEVLLSAQSEWNDQTLHENHSDPEITGIIHSARYSHENDEGQFVFPVDTGSSSEHVFKFIIDKLSKSEIPILELEIENG